MNCTNTRKAAVGKCEKSSLSYVSPTTGSEIRKDMKLSESDEYLLTLFSTSNKDTEKDVYLVFELIQDEYFKGRISIETDIPPRLIVKSIER
jgi:hypothetical protein